jgi:hypothetical protein
MIPMSERHACPMLSSRLSRTHDTRMMVVMAMVVMMVVWFCKGDSRCKCDHGEQQ